MRKHIDKIKKHLVEKQHHYKVALLFIVLFVIFFFAHTVGNSTNQNVEQVTCWSDKDCSVNQFCEFNVCLSEKGSCVTVPEVCPSLWDPVCGCDGKNYPNDCVRKISKVSKKHEGVC